MHIENNNNLSFGAYFKNNTLFKQLYSDTRTPIDKKLVDTFAQEFPAHEIEIISCEKDSINSSKIYTIFNNNTGASCKATVDNKQNAINELLKTCLKAPMESFFSFWGIDSVDRIYNILTNKD